VLLGALYAFLYYVSNYKTMTVRNQGN